MKKKRAERIAFWKGLVTEAITRSSKDNLTLSQLLKALGIHDAMGVAELEDTLEFMLTDRSLSMSSTGGYSVGKGDEKFTGIVDFVNPRFAFVRVEGQEVDVHVPADDLKSALDGDTVELKIFWSVKGKRPEGEVIRVVQRARDEFVGVVKYQNGYAYLVPAHRRMHENIFLKKEDTLDAPSGNKVVVKISEWGNSNRHHVGKVIKILGEVGENNAEMNAIMAEFGLPVDFPADIEEAAAAISDSIPQSEIAKRRDMRQITTFTIDPFDAKDFDDALSFQILPNGNIEIGVHIADVSHYVKPGSQLDNEAQIRATSVYLVDRTIPMLPEKLSNNLCSLRPKEDKLTFSAVFELNEKAKIIQEWFGRTIIHSDRRFTYEEVQEVIENKAGEFSAEILELNRLAHILRKERFSKGSIGFETPEVKFKLDENGKPLAVVPKVRKDAHKLIEDFMLLANKKVAEFVFNYKKGGKNNLMVYRIHENPNEEKLRVFSNFANHFGYQLDFEGEKVASSLNKLIDDLEGKPEQDVLQQLAIRTMAKARYTIQPMGHFGLAFKHYTHFTSPIRRYPDVLAHRMLQNYIDGQPPNDHETVERLCRQSSEMEKRASDAERASIKYKQVEFMELQNKEIEYDGIISGVTEWGFFVEIIETKCEGLVKVMDLRDDFYEYDPANYCLRGRTSKRIYTFGDKVKVKIKKTDIEKRTIDMSLCGQELLKATIRQPRSERHSKGGGRDGKRKGKR